MKLQVLIFMFISSVNIFCCQDPFINKEKIKRTSLEIREITYEMLKNNGVFYIGCLVVHHSIRGACRCITYIAIQDIGKNFLVVFNPDQDDRFADLPRFQGVWPERQRERSVIQNDNRQVGVARIHRMQRQESSDDDHDWAAFDRYIEEHH